MRITRRARPVPALVTASGRRCANSACASALALLMQASAPHGGRRSETCACLSTLSVFIPRMFRASRLFCPAVLMRTLGHIVSGAVTDRRLISPAAKKFEIPMTIRASATARHNVGYWSQYRESNPSIQLGRLTFCH